MARGLFRLIPIFLLFNLVMSLALSGFAQVQINKTVSLAQIGAVDQLGGLPWLYNAYFDFEEHSDDYLEHASPAQVTNWDVPSSRLDHFYCFRFECDTPPFYLLYSAWRSFLLV